MHVLVIHKSKSMFSCLVFRKDGIMRKSYRPKTGKESVFLSYPDFTEYKALYLEEKERKSTTKPPN
jgi:hypothetical protein